MTIVFVVDNYLSKTDGTNISAHRFREELMKLGHTVRVLAIGVEGKDMYGLKEHYIPLVTYVARFFSMRFAKFDKKVAARAFDGADLVHLFFPFQVQRKCLALAKKMGIPTSGAFHLQPENITYNMKIKLLGFVSYVMYDVFKFLLYKNVENIHCPSKLIAEELKSHKYSARMHVISNGVSDFFKPPPTPLPAKGIDEKINVLMIGRLAEEKRQDLIIKAVKCSKYRDKIQLYFAGRGPMEKRFVRMSASLPNTPLFDFFPQEELLELIYKTDIYIHASDAEAEGISCIEVFACGKVPIISNSKKSATSQFALDERSLFEKRNYKDLRDRLDYWIEHPEERERMGVEYAKLGKAYNISHSVKKLVHMFEETIKDYKTQLMINADKKIKKYNNLVRRNNHFKEFFCRVFYFGIAIPILQVFNRCFFGLKIKNKKEVKKIKNTGAVIICNHIHQMDSTICAVCFSSRKLIFVSQPSNFSLNVAGIFVDILGSVPTPSSPKEIQSFIYSLSKLLRKRRLVLFYPEGERNNYGKSLREFQRGAFYLAVDAQVPVLPVRILCRDPDGLLKFIKKSPCLTMVVGEPIYPNSILLKNDAISDMQQRAELAMQNLAAQD
jgi:1-acyl-sn-glycerol-3-phosphate acyltransferase